MKRETRIAKLALSIATAFALALGAALPAWAADEAPALTAADVAQSQDQPRAADGVWDGTADTSWYDAKTTAFTLTTPEQLAGLAEIVNGTAAGIAQDSFAGKTVTLGADVVLNATAASGRDTAGVQRNWVPIGDLVLTGLVEGSEGAMPQFDDPYYFDGTFDGNGHVVKNIYIYDNVSGTYGGVQALFANVGGHAVIRNLGIEGGYVYGRVAAGIAAISHASETDVPHFIGCYNSATIEGNGSTTRGCAGIFAGEEQHRADDNYHGGAYIANCYNVGTIKRASSGSPSAGGIAGTGSIQMYGCFNYGEVQIPSAYAGALAGNLAGSTMRVGQDKQEAFFGASAVRDCYAVADCIPADDEGIVKLYNYLDADHPKGGKEDANPAVTSGETAKFQGDAWFASEECPRALSYSFVPGQAVPKLYWEAGLGKVALTDKDDEGFVRGDVAAIPNQSYTGSPLMPQVKVYYNAGTFANPVDVQLHEGSDFAVAYANNTEIGTASATVTGVGRFSDAAGTSLTARFQIYNSDLSTVSIQPITAQWYYGKPVVPKIVVLASNGDTLKEGSDYEVRIEGNQSPSFDASGKATASVTIEPVQGSATFTGSKSIDFTILKASDELKRGVDGAYLIGSKADLQYLAWMTSTEEGCAQFDGADFRLTADIDATSTDKTYMTDRPADPMFTYWSSTAGGFAGCFDGDGHTLTLGMTEAGLSIDPDLPLAPFMYTKTNGTATFKNLVIEGSVNSPHAQAAGLLIMAQSGTVVIENVVNKATVKGNKSIYGSAAGLVVETSQKSPVSGSAGTNLLVKDCRNEGEISSIARAAGLVGALGADTATFVGCRNTGKVSGGSQGAGGLVALVLGQNDPNLRVAKVLFTDCVNEGLVQTPRGGDAGGLVGWNQEYVEQIAFNRCANLGTVSYAGAGCNGAGIIGRAYSPVKIENTYNNAKITANDTGNRPAGIIGYAAPEPLRGASYETDVFRNVYSTGKFEPNDAEAGGIVGIVWLSSTLEFDNVYYDSGGCAKGVGLNCADGYPSAIDPPIYKGEPIAQDSATMQTATFATMLGGAFVTDADHANGGFPVLAQGEAPVAKDLSSGYRVASGVPETFTYDGGPVRFDALPVVDETGAVQLEEGSDYIVFYAADGLAGRAIVQGIGDYTGSFTYEFAIEKCLITACSVSQVTAIDYSDIAGGPARQQLELRSPSGALLTEGADYEALYANNEAPGIAYLRIEGKGYYAGSVMRMFGISKGDLASVAIEGLAQHYPLSNGSGGLFVYEQLKARNGQGLERSDSPSDKGDYVRFFYDADGKLVTTASGAAAYRLTKAGEYKVVFKAEAIDREGASWTNGFWEGEASATFTYGNRMAQDCQVGNMQDVYCYTGSAIQVAPELTNKLTGYPLAEGVDYTLAYTTAAGAPVDAVRDAGDYKLVITGKDAWFGTLELAFCVQPAEFFLGDQAVVEGVDAQYFFTGEPIAVQPTSVKVGGKELYRDVEYTLSYEDASGKVVAQPQAQGAYQLVITGAGSYKGAKRMPFSIVPAFVSVYAQQGDLPATLVKSYTKDQLAALVAADCATKPVSALYCDAKGANWKVATTNNYVTLDDLLADAGAAWQSGSTVTYGSDDDESARTCTYDDAQKLMFYPATTSMATDSIGAVPAPFVFSLSDASMAIGAGGTTYAAEAEGQNLAKQGAENAPRAIMGVLPGDYAKAASNGGHMMGARLWKCVQRITVVTPAKGADQGGAEAGDGGKTPGGQSGTSASTGKLKANTLKAKGKTVSVNYSKKKARTIKAKKAYKITLAKGALKFAKKGASKLKLNKKTGAIKVPRGLKPGTYKIKVKVTARGGKGYKAKTQTVKVKVKVKGKAK